MFIMKLSYIIVIFYTVTVYHTAEVCDQSDSSYNVFGDAADCV